MNDSLDTSVILSVLIGEPAGQRDVAWELLESGSAHQIADRTGIAKSTVVDRLNKLLVFIREHRDDLV